MCVTLCALLAACYRSDQQKLDEELRALVQPGMTIAEATDRLFSHGVACDWTDRTPEVGNQPIVGCVQPPYLLCGGKMDLEPAHYAKVILARDQWVVTVVDVHTDCTQGSATHEHRARAARTVAVPVK